MYHAPSHSAEPRCRIVKQQTATQEKINQSKLLLKISESMKLHMIQRFTGHQPQ